jgi:hypothetical protein
LVEAAGVRFLIDPWIENRVFNNGWDLITPTPFSYDDFATVTHIWFSHNHPDHFSPPNLQRVAPEVRAKITVYFQEASDKGVVSFCKKIGFKEVVELKPGQWVTVADDFRILCEPYQEGDSWLAIRSDGVSLLNTNDCGIRDSRKARAIARKAGDVDVLLSQFSYAFWAGNKEDVGLRRKMANDKLEGLRFQVEMFKPKEVVPIASFVWFCHEENSYLNDSINRPDTTYDYCRRNTQAKPIILYPGERHTPGDEHESVRSIARYNEDYARIYERSDLVKAQPIPLEALQSEASEFMKRLKEHHGVWVNLLNASYIHLMDHKKTFEMTLKSGLQEKAVPYDECDISLASESLQYCFKFPWGQDTLGINGRFQKPRNGHYSRFYRYFRFEQQYSRGRRINLGYLTGILFRKIRVWLAMERI